jgi:hypothetical protein
VEGRDRWNGGTVDTDDADGSGGVVGKRAGPSPVVTADSTEDISGDISGDIGTCGHTADTSSGTAPVPSTGDR